VVCSFQFFACGLRLVAGAKLLQKEIENMTVHMILTLVLLLLSVLMAALFEPYNQQVRSFLTKISWDTIINTFFVWFCILFLRKLLYYIPLPGIIRTKIAIWCIDKNTLLALYSLLVLLLLLIITGGPQLGKKSDSPLSAAAFLLVIPYIYYIAVGEAELGLSQRIFSLFVKPLLLLKMACPGNYWGILVGVGVAYLFTGGRKKIPTKSATVKLVITVLFLSFGLGSFYYFSVGWERTLPVRLDRAQQEKGGSAFREILEATESINDSYVKLRSYNRIAVALAGTGDIPGAHHILQRSVDVVLKKDFRNKSQALKEIALAIAKIGNTQWAEAVTESIPDKETKEQTLKEIQKK
jgi:hypothetical protein